MAKSELSSAQRRALRSQKALQEAHPEILSPKAETNGATPRRVHHAAKAEASGLRGTPAKLVRVEDLGKPEPVDADEARGSFDVFPGTPAEPEPIELPPAAPATVPPANGNGNRYAFLKRVNAHRALKGAIALLSSHDFGAFDIDGITGAIGILARAEEKLGALKKAKAGALSVGGRAQVRAKFHKTYEGTLSAADLVGMKVLKLGPKLVRVEVSSGETLMLAIGHLEGA